MPICPKCRKFISEGKLQRHKSRCGKKRTVKKVISQDNIAPASL